MIFEPRAERNLGTTGVRLQRFPDCTTHCKQPVLVNNENIRPHELKDSIKRSVIFITERRSRHYYGVLSCAFPRGHSAQISLPGHLKFHPSSNDPSRVTELIITVGV